MGESKHTPQLRAGEIRHAGRTRLVEYADGRRGFAAEVQAGYIGNEVDEANRDALALLFAAAPLMLEAHEPNATPPGPDFLEFIADRLVMHGDDPNADFVLALRRKAAKARAAIKAAGGES